MAKETLTSRVDRLEECFEERSKVLGEINGKLEKLDYDVNNGMSTRIATAVTTAFREERREEREREVEQNRIMGEHKDRILKVWAMILTFLGSGSIVALVTLLVRK